MFPDDNGYSLNSIKEMSSDRIQEHFQVKNTDQISVIYHNGESESRQNYQAFLKLYHEFASIIKELGNQDVMAVDICPDLNLPVIIYSLIEKSMVFYPFSVGDLSVIHQALQKCRIIYILVKASNYDKFTEGGANLKMESTQELPFQSHVLLKISFSSESYKRIFSVTKDHIYIVQTSGTTGKAKLVLVPHNCITPNLVDMRFVLICNFRTTIDSIIINIFSFDLST